MEITVAESNGQTRQIQEENAVEELEDKTIGEEFDGSVIGLEGYRLEITGGSDADGFPMREGIEGPERTTVLSSGGQGVNVSENGERTRKTVRGNTVTEEIQQLNTKVVEEGEKSIEDLIE